MKYISSLAMGGPVEFPEGVEPERVYMVPFRPGEFPADLGRWDETIAAMLRGVTVPDVAYLMIDRSFVRAGAFHRRSGLHVDGNWIPEIQAHGGGGGMPAHHNHTPSVPSHHRHPNADFPGGGHRHRDPIPAGHIHPSRSPGHLHGGYRPEMIILASDVAACRALIGEFDGDPAADGDCSHVDIGGCSSLRLEAGRAYYGNVTLLHETLSVDQSVLRTLVRLNIPGGELRLS